MVFHTSFLFHFFSLTLSETCYYISVFLVHDCSDYEVLLTSSPVPTRSSVVGNIVIHVYFWTYLCVTSLGCTPRSGADGVQGVPLLNLIIPHQMPLACYHRHASP